MMAATTTETAARAISETWGGGGSLCLSDMVEVRAMTEGDNRPPLDVLLSACGRLDQYNRSGRPILGDFRQWWRAHRP